MIIEVYIFPKVFIQCYNNRNKAHTFHNHPQLGHSRSTKMQKTLPSLKHLSSLICKGCQLDKHIRQSFRDSLLNKFCFLSL